MATEEEVLENDESLIALTTHFAQVELIIIGLASCSGRA
jgi:lauroyl/myristoyl acyltransferase